MIAMVRALRNQAWDGSLIVFWASLCTFFYYLASYGQHFTWPAFSTFYSLLLPLGIYLLAHLLRAVRLGLLMGNLRIRQLLTLYFYCAACSAFIPFKLGDLVRVNEVSRWMNSYWQGILIVWIERLFDLMALAVLMLFLIWQGKAEILEQFTPLLWVMFGFMWMSLLFFFIIPEQLYVLILHVIKKYQGRKAVTLLRIIDSVYELVHHRRPFLKGRRMLLTLLTFIIWGLELKALTLVLNDASKSRAIEALMGNLSELVSLHASVSQPALILFNQLQLGLIGGLGIVSVAFYLKLRARRYS